MKLMSVGVKLKVSLRLSPCRIVGLLLTLVAFYTPCAQMWTSTFVEEVSAWYRLMVHHAGNKKTG